MRAIPLPFLTGRHRPAVTPYGGRIVALAALAASYPLAGLFQADRGAFALALLATLATLTLLVRRLTPLDRAVERLRASAEMETSADNGSGDGLLADVEAVTTRLAELRHREDMRHPVTQMATREPFLEQVDTSLSAGEAAPGVLGTVRFADYDRLAAFDQAAADRALRAFADRLQGAVARNRPLAQVDRASFAIWFGASATASAAAELQALAYVLTQEFVGDGSPMTAEVELGAAMFPADGNEAAVLLTRAIAALTRPSAARGPLPAFFAGSGAVTARQDFELVQDLRQALTRGEFALEFQPVVDVAEGRIVAAEALIRWHHPRLGTISPNRFVPILEDSGLVEDIGLWALGSACREARAWIERGLGPLKVAVNLSARQLHDPALPATIARTLDLYRLPPQHLELELTETAAMEDAGRTHAMFTALREIGVSLAIDDFGTGYSSLSYVKNLPFDKLKIDREFVHEADSRRDSQAICRTLVALARGLDLSVLAEGVETRAEMDTLMTIGCTTFQGFYFSRPLSGPAFAEAVADQDWLRPLVAPTPKSQRLIA